MTARLAMSESTTAMWRFPTKSNFVPWGTMSKVLNCIRRSASPCRGG